MHDLPLITTLATAFTAAWLLGLITQRLGLSPIVGYLLAGVLIGPHTPGFVGHIEIAQQLAEVGVILLMFGVGLHFHMKDLLAVKSVAIPGAIGQSLVATLLGIAVFAELGMPAKSGAVLGMAMAVASTVVLMRVLMDADALNSPQGHVAVGWLLVEDVFTVVVLVLIPILAGGDAAHSGEVSGLGLWASLGLALLKLSALVAIVMLGGSRIIPWALVQVARLRSRELFTLTILVVSIAVAAAAYTFFGASMALGAFLAGMVVAQSPVSHQAAADALPMRDAFAVIFFVSVGMLFDPAILLHEPLMLVAALGIILIAKPLAAIAIVATLGHSPRTALTVGLGLAQIGEFSFILSELAARNGLMSEEGHSVLVASAILTITLNPILFRWINPIEDWLRKRPVLWKLLNNRAERRLLAASAEARAHAAPEVDDRSQLAIVIGFGPVGRSVHRLLRDAGMATVVIDTNMDTISELNSHGVPAVFGDATHEAILEQAGMRRASHLVITLPHTAHRAAVVTAARNLNSEARVLVRAHYLREREELERAGASAAVFEEAEAAVALARLVLADTGEQRDEVERKIRDIRLQLILEDSSVVRAQQLRNFMIPWPRVDRLSAAATRAETQQLIAGSSHSLLPVTDPRSGEILGALMVGDLIGGDPDDGNWKRFIIPLRTVHPENDAESTLRMMQREGESMCLVEDGGVPVGIVTLRDVLDGVIGRMRDSAPTGPEFSLREAIAAGGILSSLAGHTPEQVITEMAAAIPSHRLPADANIAELALAREREHSTDLGTGVAVPHARCAGLSRALVVIGRSQEGVLFSPRSSSDELVHLVFLFVTPLEQPKLQLDLLAQLARIAGDAEARDRLLKATTDFEILDVLCEHSDVAPRSGASAS